MDRITQSYMNDFLNSQGIEEKEQSRQFELFATYCAIEKHYSEVYDLLDIITGEGGDCGIDAIAIIVNGDMITSKEEVDDILDMNKKFTDISFVFIQAKTTSNFNYGDLGTFGAGVKDFFSEQPQMVRNSFIKEKGAIASYIFSKAKYIKRKPNCYMYYVTTGKWVGDENCNGRINMVVEELQDLNIFEDVKYIPVDANLLQKYYRSTIDAIETEIEFENKILLPDIEDVKQSYLGYISFDEYLKLILRENGDIRKSVFYDNVRDFQGENPVNSEIAETVCVNPNKFVLFNNGVTIICKRMTGIGRKYTLTDYQIVNGCQTSHVIYNNKENITGELNIPIKIIETEDDETVNRIIKATNRQTEVPNEQLITLNEFHRRLENFYSTFPKEKRLYYERRSKQYNCENDIEKVRIVSIGTQIKAVASMFYDKPHLASRYYGRLLNSVEGIFDEDHQLLPYYTSAYTLYRLEYLFRSKALMSQYRKYRYYILMMIKYSVVKGKVPEMNSRKMESLCGKILDIVNESGKLVGKINGLTPLIEKYVKDINSTESTKSAGLVESLKSEF